MGRPITVLLSNDDGPPGKESPWIFRMYMDLKEKLGWDVKVVIPSSQKSWIGKAYQIKDTIKGVYYYPKAPDGLGEISDTSRPLKEGEVGEWILLDGTPATCVNVGLHNIYPNVQIDLVLSGPNYGRNSSSAFTLSSGTIGAALSACLSGKRAIAVSYGTIYKVENSQYTDSANDLAIKIIDRLWNGWGSDPEGMRKGEVDLYNVNIPIIRELLNPESLEVAWTHVWKNNYGQLFKRQEEGEPSSKVRAAGPDATPSRPGTIVTTEGSNELPTASENLLFKFAPQIAPLVNPPFESLPHGSDGWAIHSAKASVTPLRAAFAEPGPSSMKLSTEEPGEELRVGRVFKL